MLCRLGCGTASVSLPQAFDKTPRAGILPIKYKGHGMIKQKHKLAKILLHVPTASPQNLFFFFFKHTVKYLLIFK